MLRKVVIVVIVILAWTFLYQPSDGAGFRFRGGGCAGGQCSAAEQPTPAAWQTQPRDEHGRWVKSEEHSVCVAGCHPARKVAAEAVRGVRGVGRRVLRVLTGHGPIVTRFRERH